MGKVRGRESLRVEGGALDEDDERFLCSSETVIWAAEIAGKTYCEAHPRNNHSVGFQGSVRGPYAIRNRD